MTDLDIDKIAAAICYGLFPEGMTYGQTPELYWRSIVEPRKELYRKATRAAVAEIERQMKATPKETK